MAEVTKLVRTHLPAIESSLDFHPANLLFTLSMMKSKSCLVELDCFRGNPKYFPKFEVASKPMVSQIESQEIWETLGEKNILDFNKLTLRPDSSQNDSYTSLMLWLFLRSALAKRTKSSA